MTDPTAQDNQQTPVPLQPPQPVTVPHGSKEAEGRPVEPLLDHIEETGQVEMEPEVEQAGVVAHKEHIEVPPDLKKLGVTASGASMPVDDTGTLKNLKLPLTSQQIEKGLHAKIIDSIAWLATWCMKQIKRNNINPKSEARNSK